MKKIINVSVLFLSLLLIVLSSFSKNVNAYLNNNSYADKAVKAILNDYYNDGVYRKDTIINLTESAKAEVIKMFHASCNHLERITYYNGEEIWMTNTSNTINSGYETVNGDMLHFKKIDGQNVYDYCVPNTITTEYYQTLKNLRDTSGWKVSGTSYINNNEDVIDKFRQFAAPLWLATDEAKDYIVFTSVKIFTSNNGLHIQLLTSSTDNGKLTNSNGIFSEAIVTTNREEKQLEITSVNAYAPEFIKIFTQNYDIKMADYVEAKIINDEGEEYSGVLYDYLEKQSNYRFIGMNLTTDTYELCITAYAASGIYEGSVIISNSKIVDASSLVSLYEQKIDDLVNQLVKEDYKQSTYDIILAEANKSKNSLVLTTNMSDMNEIVKNFEKYVLSIKPDFTEDVTEESNINTVLITFKTNYSVEGEVPLDKYSCNIIEDGVVVNESIDKSCFRLELYKEGSSSMLTSSYLRLYSTGKITITSEYKILSITIKYLDKSTLTGSLEINGTSISLVGDATNFIASAEVNSNSFSIRKGNAGNQLRIVSIEITYEK